jgi:prolyl-tRNA synthetase
MRYSQIFSKSSKSRPADAESVNARLLVQGGFVHQEMAGVYSWLPLGLRILQKVEDIVRDELNKLGAQEILMSALQPKENWLTTNRWDVVDVLFKVPSQTGKEYALGPTHEEIVTPLVKEFVASYKDLPTAVYQIQSKFRDELRAKSGIIRGREFRMKDLYSFHANPENLEVYYEQVKEAYLAIFSRCGIDVKVTEASGGDFTKKLSHEFQALSSAGEDLLIACPNCTFAQNTEVATLKAGEQCPKCAGELFEAKGIEVGNIFDLSTRFTDSFAFTYTDEYGERKPVFMGCYGLGTSRLVGAIVEASNDDKGIIWPKSVAPYQVHIVMLSAKDESVQGAIDAAANKLYADLQVAGVEVLLDDRVGLSAGEKFADADLLGMPVRVVISEKSLKTNSIEIKTRKATEAHLVDASIAVEQLIQTINE